MMVNYYKFDSFCIYFLLINLVFISLGWRKGLFLNNKRLILYVIVI